MHDDKELPFSRAGAPDALPPETPEQSGEPRIQGTMVIMKLRKTAELLDEQKYQARVALTDTFEDLATRFTRVGSVSFEAFEKDAFYKWGDAAGPCLQLIRQSLRLPTADYDYTVMSKIARVIDSSTYEMQQFQKLMQHQQDIKQLDEGRQKVTGYLERLSK